MASLALGAAGAFAGSLIAPGIGTSIGWALGAAAGNLLFSEKPPAARLHDLHLQGSSYGAMLKMFWGKVRLSGNVIWQTDLQEHVSGGKGGKGEPETASYTASWDLALTETQIAAVKKIWAGGRLNYDSEQEDTGALPFTFYDGNPDQLPDPTEEAVEGVGNVPAYRGISRMVFRDVSMGQFGNTHPQLSAEVVSSAGSIPWRVSTFNAVVDLAAPYNMQGTYVDGVITVGAYKTSTYESAHFLLDGTPVGSPVYLSEPLETLGDNTAIPGANGGVSNLQVGYCYHAGALAFPNAAWYVGPNIAAIVDISPVGGPLIYSAMNGVYQDGYIYAGAATGGGAVSIIRWIAPNGVPTSDHDAGYFIGAASGITNLHISANSGSVFVTDSGAITSSYALWKFDAELNLIHVWTRDDLPAIWDGTHHFVYYHGMVAVNVQNGASRQIVVYRVEDDYTFTLVGSIDQSEGPEIQMFNGLVLSEDGVVSLDPPDGSVFLSEVVGDLCVKAGYAPDEYNVTALSAIRVDGAIIEAQTTCRAGIEMFMPVYFFDAVERDGVITFVVRGGESVVTFLEDDLAAHMDHDGLPALLSCLHIPDIELPGSLTIAYINREADYQVNTQISQRMIGGSRNTQTVSVPIVLSDEHAKKIVDSWLYNAWSERDSYTWYTSRKYAAYEPTDVCTVLGKVLRITKKLEGATGVIKWEGVPSRGANFVQAGAGGAAKDPSQTLTSAQASQLVLLDIPLVEDTDAPGIYVAMAGAVRSTYSGGLLYESVDGVSYTSIAAITRRSTIGATSNALGDFFGGNVFDEGNVLTVVIGLGGGTLASVSADEVLNGANKAVVGSEIIQFKNAVLVAPSTYELSGLLRGRRGTEWATNTHSIGERFVMLPVTNLAIPASDLGRVRYFKAVTFGKTLAQTTAQQFTNMGNAWRPYSPVHLGGGTDASGNVILNWTRRTRIGGVWSDFVDVPLSEAVEEYVVQIWDASYTVCARIISVSAAQTVTYTSAQQVTDFGAQQQTIYFSVGQKGSYNFGSQEFGSAPGAGGSNVLPLVPITPYAMNPIVAPPPPPGGGGTRPVDHVFTQPSEIYLPDMVIGQVWVGQFTTGATLPTSGHIRVAEHTSPAVTRQTWLATDSAGINRVPLTTQYGSTTEISIPGPYGITLLPLTTYYWINDYQFSDGTYPAPVGQGARSIIDFWGIP